MTSTPSIQYALKDKCLFLKLKGSFRHDPTASWEPFVAHIFNREPLNMAIIDLTQATYLDSTNLGIIASIAVRLRAVSKQKPLIVTASEDVTILLVGMGFEQYFAIVDDSAAADAPPYCGIDLARLTPAALRDVTLQAHQNLADMNTKNRQAFKDVIELLEQETTP